VDVGLAGEETLGSDSCPSINGNRAGLVDEGRSDGAEKEDGTPSGLGDRGE
jgi:hypothetical protein